MNWDKLLTTEERKILLDTESTIDPTTLEPQAAKKIAQILIEEFGHLN